MTTAPPQVPKPHSYVHAPTPLKNRTQVDCVKDLKNFKFL